MNQMARIDTAMEAQMANAIRALAMDVVETAKSGHPGAPMGMADVAAVLFNRFMTLDPADAAWPDRDRFVMSAGHGSMLVYAINHMLGYDVMDRGQLRNFRQPGARTAGHPERGHAKGIATAVGMALAERMMNARFGDDLVAHWTCVLCGDGCLMKGIQQEAIDLAGHQRLGRLIVLWDDNRVTIDGHTDLCISTDRPARLAAAGWHVQAVDGHDREAVAAAIEAAREDERPSLNGCRTVIGCGAPNTQGSHDVHGAPPDAAEIAAARAPLGRPHEPFDIPQDLLDSWRPVSARGVAARSAWQERLDLSPLKPAFSAMLAAPDAAALRRAIRDHVAKLVAGRPKVAARKASEMALEVVNATVPNTVAGSADLTGPNNSRSTGMAAIVNGIAPHGGLIPYGGTFPAFSDYSRPAIQPGTLTGVPGVHVVPHDSIGLGDRFERFGTAGHASTIKVVPMDEMANRYASGALDPAITGAQAA